MLEKACEIKERYVEKDGSFSNGLPDLVSYECVSLIYFVSRHCGTRWFTDPQCSLRFSLHLLLSHWNVEANVITKMCLIKWSGCPWQSSLETGGGRRRDVTSIGAGRTADLGNHSSLLESTRFFLWFSHWNASQQSLPRHLYKPLPSRSPLLLLRLVLSDLDCWACTIARTLASAEITGCRQRLIKCLVKRGQQLITLN